MKPILVAVFALLSYFSSALAAHLGDTPDQIKSQLGAPVFFLGPDLALKAPTPADIVYMYDAPGEKGSIAFYFKDGTCGAIMVIRSIHSDPFTIEDLRGNFEKYTGVQRAGCQEVDEPNNKSIVSIGRVCLGRTMDPTTLYIEDFRFFVTEAQERNR
jgi:hypothetical protein